jgi:hypothetical protein
LNKQEFEDFQLEHGKFLKGVETFEESNIPPGADVGLPNPLRGNVRNVDPLGIGFPTGLEQKNIVIQDNMTPGCNPPNPNPGNRGQDTGGDLTWHITVNGKSGAEIGQFVLTGGDPEPAKAFLGIWCDLGIGRINICAASNLFEVVDLQAPLLRRRGPRHSGAQ